MQQGEREFLTQKYIQGGYTPEQAAQKVNQITSTRNIYPGEPAVPTSATPPPLGPQVSQTRQLTPQPSPAVPSQTQPVNKIDQLIEQMIQSVQAVPQTGDPNADLRARQKAIYEARFGAVSDVTPESLRVLSPQAQSRLRGLDVSGLEGELSQVTGKIQQNEQKATQEREAKQQQFQNLMSVLGLLNEREQQQVAQGKPVELSSGEIVRFTPDGGIETLREATESGSTSDPGKLVKIGDKEYIQNADGTFTEPNVPVSRDPRAIQQAQNKVNMINEILSDSYFTKVFGPTGIITRFDPRAQLVKNKVNQLIGDLVLDERGRLKGSGQISDFETKIIQRAATPLGTNLTDKQAKQVLEDIREKFNNVVIVDQLIQEMGITEEEAYKAIGYDTNSFKQESQTSLKGTDVSKVSNNTKLKTGIGTGTVTGIDGSRLWKWGLDFVLSGGKGAAVPLPAQFAGAVVKKVVNAFSNPKNSPLTPAEGKKQNSGFGNQVVLKLPSGDEVMISHLDRAVNLKPGQLVQPGTILGFQGNTGSTYGNTGTHLDITIKKSSGGYYTARQVASILGATRLT